jgi:hypothetical protein
MRVIAGEDYISSRSIQHQWVGKHIKNDISKCMLVFSLEVHFGYPHTSLYSILHILYLYYFFLAIWQFMTMFKVHDTWASLAWDMKRRQLTIHAAGNKNGEWDAYDQIVDTLKSAFRRCSEVFFDGWFIDWKNWATVYSTATRLSDKKPDE